jgi:hypothetical protein
VFNVSGGILKCSYFMRPQHFRELLSQFTPEETIGMGYPIVKLQWDATHESLLNPIDVEFM